MPRPRLTSYPAPRRVSQGSVSKPKGLPPWKLRAQLPPTRRVKADNPTGTI